MKTLKINFTVPEDVVGLLKSRVSKHKRTALMTSAIPDNLEEEQLKQSLMEGYQSRKNEDIKANREWEDAHSSPKW